MRRSATLVFRSAFVLCVALLAGCGPTEEEAHRAAYDQLVDDFLAWHFADNPVRATRLGMHEHDHALPDLTRQANERRVTELNQWLRSFGAIDPEMLELDDRLDFQVLDHAIRAELLELEEVRDWERQPAVYLGTISSGLALLVDRDFAPVEQRAEHVLTRLGSIGRVLDAARENLSDVPELWAEDAVRQARATASYLREGLIMALDDQGIDRDLALRSQVVRNADRAAGTLEEFAGWLETDLLPRADGDFRLGPEVFERKLMLEEHVELSVDELREINEREIERYQEWIAEVAAEIDPDRDPAAVIEEMAADFPPEDELVTTAEQFQDQAREFVLENDLVTLPGEEEPTVRETPDYARGGFASMSTPGPFETEATEAYYNITNVLPEWTDEQKREHLTYFNRPGLLGVTVHESFPGHFVDFLYRPSIESRVRKIFGWGSRSEGWAHYVEQMMVDEGLGGGDPLFRLGQLRRAVQRHARWYAGLEMHAFGATVDEATDRYQQIAYFAPFPALQEVERGTRNPTYLYYALGRMQILQLREDYREHLESQGETFSLRDFHDRFLQIGLPVPLARQIMIPGDDRPSIR